MDQVSLALRTDQECFGARTSALARVGALAALFACSTACSAGPDDLDTLDLAVDSQELYRVGAVWPNGVVPVCWDSASVARSDFAVRSTQVRRLANASWPVYGHVYFTGWGTCPANSAGRVRVRLNTDMNGNAGGIGYVAAGRTMDLGTQRPDFGGSLVPHEFGHELGFSHEMARPGFPDDATGPCMEANIAGGDTEGTTADRDSIMASTGYCQQRTTLSGQDQLGVRNAYGAPNCTRRTESHTDPNTGVSWSTVWYCGNRSGAPMYASTNTNTVIGWMDSSTSWFSCYSHGAQHAGGNNVWYYSQGDRSASGQSARQAWGYMPAVNVWTDVDPHPNIPECCGGRSCNQDSEFCSGGSRCCPVDRCAPGCPC